MTASADNRTPLSSIPSEMELDLYAPTGSVIEGTLEVVYGVCGIGSVKRSPNGVLDIDDDGNGTELDWNSQRQARRGGHHIFVCSAGQEWAELELQWAPSVESGEQASFTSTDQSACRTFLRQRGLTDKGTAGVVGWHDKDGNTGCITFDNEPGKTWRAVWFPAPVTEESET